MINRIKLMLRNIEEQKGKDFCYLYAWVFGHNTLRLLEVIIPLFGKDATLRFNSGNPALVIDMKDKWREDD